MAVERSQIRVLFETWGPMVFRRARRLLGSDADAEEAVQEVFIRALSGLESFDGRSAASTWLYQITTNYCLNRLRDRRRRQELWDEKIEPAESRATDALPHVDIVALRKVLAEADPREAAAAIYVFLDGMSHDEAAELLGTSRRTVGNLVDRFVKSARARLEGGAA